MNQFHIHNQYVLHIVKNFQDYLNELLNPSCHIQAIFLYQIFVHAEYFV